ncbi:hypothetical protein BC629DRAFT_816844 [Irpex lacteus]|nr:hypothetical protein BC629DRAFT_816844 [Irpex lacteus]
MVKSKEDTIAEFNEQVNMSVEELEEWLENPQSKKAGTGVGLESAAKIIEILKKNPDKDPEKYEDDDLEHMRKVVGYNKRHMAQEDHLKETKTREELEITKSTISLKNWGHDPMKTLDDATEDAEDEKSTERDVSTSPKKDVEAKNKKSSDDKEVGSKRKHDEATEANSESEVQKNGKDTEVTKEVGGKEEDVDDGEKDGESEGRARKKSKTNAKSHSETPTDEAVEGLLQ